MSEESNWYEIKLDDQRTVTAGSIDDGMGVGVVFSRVIPEADPDSRPTCVIERKGDRVETSITMTTEAAWALRSLLDTILS